MYLTTVPPEKAMIRKIMDIFKEENMIALIKVHLGNYFEIPYYLF